jgi:hypothetical protein
VCVRTMKEDGVLVMPIITNHSVPTSIATRNSHDAPVDPLVDMYGRNFGPRIAEVTNAWRTALSGNLLSNRRLDDRIFGFCDETGLGIRMEAAVYEADDAYVRSAPIRNAVATKMTAENNGSKVVYVESAGLAEVGAGLMMGFRIATGPFVAVGWSFGVTTSLLYRYRTSMPVLLSQGETPDDHLKYKHLDFPFSADIALKMSPGAEVEMSGQGRLLSNIGVGVVGGAIFPGGSAGVGAAFGVNASVRDEISVSVLALDKPGRVRVTIRKLDEEVGNTLARIRAGFISMQGFVTGNLAGGFLRFYTEKLGAPNFEELLNLYTTLNASVYGGVAHRVAQICAWDLDLNDPSARSVYEHLVLLNAIPAEESGETQYPGIRRVCIKENEEQTRLGVDIGIFGQKLFVYETTHTERNGAMTTGSGTGFKYRNAIFTHRKRNILRGTRDIAWEAVFMRTEKDGHIEPYLHVRHQYKDWDFGSESIDQMLRFADAMGMCRDEVTGDNAHRLERATKRLVEINEVMHLTDVYFTKQGVVNIGKVDFQSAKEAFLKASSVICKTYHDFDFAATTPKAAAALAIIDQYLSMKKIMKLYERIHHAYLYDAYRELTGRNLTTDADLIRQANEFGALVHVTKNPESPQELVSFFHELSQKHRLHYMQTVAALAVLAGRGETRVNALSLSGGGISITNVPEGAIANPRAIIAEELYKLAD